jgi:hypothetical protein
MYSSHEDAFKQLYEVVKAYEPGQSNIDGGGFDVVTFDPKAGYIYVQFESLKNGFIDDFEFALVDNDKDKNAVQVRSSSRLGYVSRLFFTVIRCPVRVTLSSLYSLLRSPSWTLVSMLKGSIISRKFCGLRVGMRLGWNLNHTGVTQRRMV